MDARDAMLDRVRKAVGRKLGQKPLPPPEPLLRVNSRTGAEKLALFQARFLGMVTVVPSLGEARAAVEKLLDGADAVASGHPFLESCGVGEIAGVNVNPENLRNTCSTAAVGITSAYCLLAETGTIVLRACAEEPRLISLLPPVHIAIVHQDRLLSNLDEMLSMTPRPVDSDSSAMVLISGPSKTGDIEQFLVRGVHGPGVIHTVIVQGKIPTS